MADVYHMFDDSENDYILYIGRPTCHYCRDFSPVLKEFNGLTGSQLYYYNTDRDDFTVAAKEFLTKKVGMFATPTTLYIDKGQLISGWVGSGITAQNLYNKLYTHTIQKKEYESENNGIAPAEAPNTDKENTKVTDEKVTAVPIAKKSDFSQTIADKTSKKSLTLNKIITQILSLIRDALLKLNI